jgi:hypothetical protein
MTLLAKTNLLEALKQGETAEELGREASLETPTVAEILPPMLEPFVAPIETIFGKTGTPTVEEGSANTAPPLEGKSAMDGTARAVIGGIGFVVAGALLLSIF